MLKVNSSKRFMKKGGSLILASLLLASVFNNDVSTVHAVNEEERMSSIYDELINSDLSKTTRGILKAMADTTRSDMVLSLIDIALDDVEDKDYFIAQAISTFAQEQEKIKYKDAYEESEYNPYLYINYSIDDICVYDNLSGLSATLPKQICLLTKLGDFETYSIYEVHDTNPSYIITDKDGYILTYSVGDKFRVFEYGMREVTPLKEFLNNNGLSWEDSYSYLDLFEKLTFDVSEKLNGYRYPTTSRASDVMVIDGTKHLTTSTDGHDDYYFIKYGYPYLFIKGRDVYKDVVNPSSRVTVDELDTLRYYDEATETELFDLDMHFVTGGPTSSCLVSLKEFAKDNDFKVGFYVTDDFLINVSNQYNEKGESLEKNMK